MSLLRRWQRRAGPVTLAAAAACLATSANAAVGIDMTTSNLTPVAGGGAFTYTLALTNDASPTSDLRLTLPLAADAIFQGVSVSGAQAGQFACEGPPVGENGTVACEAALLPAAGVASIVVTAQFRSRMSGGVRTSTARLASSAGAVTGQVQQTVSNNAGVSTAEADVASGTARVRRLVVSVSGNSDAVNPAMSTVLPSSGVPLSISGSGALAGRCSFSPVNRQVACQATFVPTGTHAATIRYRFEPAVFGDGFE